MLEDGCAAPILATVRKLCASMKIRPYDLESGQGFLRHALIRKGFHSGQIMVVLVTTRGEFRSKRSFVNELIRRHPEITTVVRNINPTDTPLFLGSESHVLYGEGYITDRLCGLDFRISPRSFYQVNPLQTEILYGKAKEFAGLTGSETVIDAYCGTGTIGLTVASGAKEVIGVEVNKDAVADAMENAKRNGVTNAVFHAADAGEFMEAMAAKGQTADVVITDPPRAGCSGKFLHSLMKLAPKRIVYVSCNPETLARDLYTLSKGGYKVRRIQPVDMFPWTGHAETVVLLSKGNIDSKKIRVEFSLEDMDMSEFQNDATYPQIKEHVLEHTGLKVSSLYIAQVKQKCGIIERENYNKPKSENHKQPKCPPEKEKAIMEALKYFGMI